MSYSKAELERAMERDEIVPYFQPLIEMQSGRIVGFEALARWQHPHDGLVLPKDFILLSESTGLSRNLTFTIMRQVVETACNLPPNLDYSVNISPLQLREPHLPQTFKDAVRAGDPSGTFPLDRLIIEITESAFVHNLGQAASIAAEIKALGLRLAIDDFGTGYSSLLHLQSLPFDTIKVDQSFVRHMARQRGSRKIVSAVIGLGASLGLTTVAEGVEDEEQERILQSLGCNLGQGWRFGRPMPAKALPEFLAAAEKSSYHKCSWLAKAPLDELKIRTEHSSSLQTTHMQTALAGVPVGFCLLDRKMHITSINKQLATMLPYSGETLLGQALEEFLPQAAFLLRPYIFRALKGEPVHGIEIPLHQLSARQQATYAMVSLQPIHNDANEVIEIAASVTNVTRRKQVHDALRQNNAFLNAIWSSAPFGIVTAMGAGSSSSLSGNPEAERILRHPIIPPSQDLERKAWRIFDEQASPIAFEDTPLMRASREAIVIQSERLIYFRGDDTLTTLEVTASPLLTKSGKILGSVMILTDLEEKPEIAHPDSLAASLAASHWSGETESST